MKVLGALLVALIVLIQYPLWLGKGGWLRAWQVEQELQVKKNENGELEVRNAALAVELPVHLPGAQPAALAQPQGILDEQDQGAEDERKQLHLGWANAARPG